jgi:glycosyltransferase involved in cell wall biosynthesis
MSIKTLIVTDVEFSALSIAARSRARIHGAEIVYATNHLTPRSLLRKLITKNPSLIIFSWRQSLIDVLKVSSGQELELLRRRSVLCVLIPDHLAISAKTNRDEIELLNYVDCYSVTSEILFQLYSSHPDVPNPTSVLHDIPDVELIRKVRSEKVDKKPNKAIWVGNSKWGVKQGYHDHKGFNSVIQPLSLLCKSHESCTDIEIVDSALGHKTNEDVLRKVHASEMLLHPSVSEGTGLPILEALGLGVLPITTDVGIASEIFREHANLIASRDPQTFHSIIHRERLSPTFTSQQMIQIFENYINLISNENLPISFQRREGSLNWKRARITIRLQITLIWIFRFTKMAKYLRILKRGLQKLTSNFRSTLVS